MDNNIIVVSTDGSCLESTIGPMGWAWITRDLKRDYGGYKFGTNQVAELCAVLQALRAHHEVERLVIESDSEYAIHSSTDWLSNWKIKAKPWTNSEGKALANLPLIQAIDYELLNRPGQVAFRWVKGHSGDEYNEAADNLAQGAARAWQSGEEVGSMPEEAFRIKSVKYGSDTDHTFVPQTLF
jgi:ribonuclease HI